MADTFAHEESNKRHSNASAVQYSEPAPASSIQNRKQRLDETHAYAYP
jgi:hypothetical protein